MVLSNIRLRRLTWREVGGLDLAHVMLVGVEEFASAAWSLVRIGGRALEEFAWEGVVTRRTSLQPLCQVLHQHRPNPFPRVAEI